MSFPVTETQSKVKEIKENEIKENRQKSLPMIPKK